MATYTELFDLLPNSELANRVVVAVMVAAEAIRAESPPATALRLAWASSAFSNPTQEAQRMLRAVLAANKDATVAQITGASDAAIQVQVDAAVTLFAGA